MEFVDLENVADAQIQLLVKSAIIAVATIFITVLINWRIKYQLTAKVNRDVLFRRITFFGVWLLVVILMALFLIPMFIEDMVFLITEDEDEVSPKIKSTWKFCVLLVTILHPIFYWLYAFIASKFGFYKHFTVFKSDNKIFGVIGGGSNKK